MSEVNTLFPYRGGFVRADRADDYQPAQVTARAANVSGTAIEQAHTMMINAKAQFEKHLDGIQRDRYSAEGLREQIANFAETDAARAVNTAVEQVRQRRDQAQTQSDKVRRELSPDGDTAAELRAARSWDRTQRLLDNTKGEAVALAAQGLMASADRREFGVLLQELPAYLAARGQNADWIDDAVSQLVPEYGSARVQLTKAQQACIIAERNAKSLRASFTQGRSATVLVDPRGKYDPDQ